MTSSMGNQKMEARSCGHLHFIQAIRDGEVTRLINVSGGRPALRFKTVNEVREPRDAKRTTLPPSRTKSKNVSRSSKFHSDKVKVEVPDHLTRTDEQPSEFNSFVDDNERDYDLDDMTLSQIKERCRMKKRKQSTAAVVDGKNVVGFDDKDGFSSSQIGEDDHDLELPLIKLKSKLKGNVRGGKRKSKKKQVASSFENAIVVVKTEQTWFEDFSLHSNWDLPMPLALKVEVPEDYHTGNEMMALVPRDCSIADDEREASHFSCAREELQQANECLSIVEVPSPESPFENMGEDECKSTSGEAVLTEDNLEARSCIKDLQSEPREEDCPPNGGFRSHVDGGSLQLDEDSEEPIPIRTSKPQLHELADAESPFDIETSSTSSSINDSTSYYGASPNPRTTTGSISSTDGLSLNEDELSQKACADVATICLEGVPPDAVQEHITSQRAQNKEVPKLQHTFRRLFSTRKVISPTSQERLREAMRSNELSDEEIYKCKGKLYLRKQGPEKIPSDEIVDRVKKGELNGTFKKQKNDRKGSPPQSIQKARQISSLATSRMNSECNTMRTPSENAIAFSQRQMQDIENLTTKVMVELKSVKEIVEEASHSGASGAIQTKFGADEVKARIENATRVEETAKRWLSMMGRDCSRFCKIMRLTENGRCAPGTEAHRQGKKVCFADESGRKLCHVQYI